MEFIGEALVIGPTRHAPLVLVAESQLEFSYVKVGGFPEKQRHGAARAREFGAPAVTSSSIATREIKTGDRLRLGGTAGVVGILSSR